jgi:hypothetical protein
MTRDTVGKISRDLSLKTPDSKDPIALQQEMTQDYIKNLEEVALEFRKNHQGDFFVVGITKKEPLMQNVIRNYFAARQSCPSPDYDQAVYRYSAADEAIEFLWVIPSRDTCFMFKNNVLSIVPEERGLLQNVLDFADGTLFRRAKMYNNEQIDSPLLETV